MPESGIRVLVVDDDPAIRRFLTISLTAEGHTVFESSTGAEAVDTTILKRPDLLLLDLQLPDMNGLEVVMQLRQWTNLPIIILSVHHTEAEKIAALDAGADDYLTKPFSVGELSARMRVALRHIPQPTEIPAFITGDLEVDLAHRQVKMADAEIQLTPTEYDILKILVVHAGKVLTQRQLVRELWGDSKLEDVHLLRVHLSNLRAKIEPDPAHPQYIITEPGIGYRLRVQS